MSNLEQKRIFVVFAHPDDEGAVAGTLARYARDGAHVTLVCATRGEAGEISDPSLAKPENLGAVREAELRCACEAIGIADLHLLNYCDSGMDGTPENDRLTAFIQADPDEVRFKLVKLMREIRPHMVITFEPNGWYGHPDHIAAGRYATEAYQLAGDPEVFPAAGPPWRPDRLFHAAFLLSSIKMILDYAREHGLDIGAFDNSPLDESSDESNPIEEQITHTLNVRADFDVKDASLRCHKTQYDDNSIFRQVPRDIMLAAMGTEYFIQVFPPMEPADTPETNLFAGIPVS